MLSIVLRSCKYISNGRSAGAEIEAELRVEIESAASPTGHATHFRLYVAAFLAFPRHF